MAVLAIGFINDDICWVCLQRSLGTVMVPAVVAINSPGFSSSFLTISVYLSFLVWVGLIQSRNIVSCPKRLEKLIPHPTLFLVRGTLCSWKVPS